MHFITLNRTVLRLLLLCLIALFMARCTPPPDDATPRPGSRPADQYPADVALRWSALHLQLIRHSAGYSPPVASRSLGYAGLALYEAVVAGMPANRSLAGQLPGLTTLPTASPTQPYNWALCANAAQATILRALFANSPPAQRAGIDSLETAIRRQYTDPDDIAQASATFGRQVAQAVVDWSKNDGGHEGFNRNFPATYTVPVGAGHWLPTENGLTVPMQPYWGQNRTFVAANNALPMPRPLPVSTDVTSQYYAQYLEVYARNRSLSDADKAIAVWWADDPGETFTPPGHSYNLARIAARAAGADLGKTAETLARVGLTVADAFILCWRCKYTYLNERPYTFVRRAIDPNWVPFWPAPPFPGFPSGHATQSAAAATVLTALYGDTFAFTDDSHVGRARDTKRNVGFTARSFRSFWEAAEESALSRFLGGIHTRQDNETGLQEGRTIGRNVNALGWRK